MTSIPQCMYCKNAKIKGSSVICTKYEEIPFRIADGRDICKYHENKNKN